MRTIIISLFVCCCWSCQEHTSRKENDRQISKENNTKQALTIKQDTLQSNTEKANQEIDIDYIKHNTKLASTTFTIPGYRDSLIGVPKEFLETYVFDAPVSIGHAKTFPKDTPDFFRFYEYKEFPNHFLFTIDYADESCCHMVYGFVVDKASKKIVDTGLLGLRGGDGGWGEEDSGTWENDTLLQLLKVEVNSEDVEDIQVAIDSVWAKIEISSQGKFHYEKLDSVHTMTTESNL